MKTIAIISQKGGAGKTTAAVHLATAAALAGHRAAIIDLDPQGTAASWGDRRQADAPEVVSGQAARLGVLIEAAQGNGTDLLVLDTRPTPTRPHSAPPSSPTWCSSPAGQRPSTSRRSKRR
jgi:chromosome partitioning protein